VSLAAAGTGQDVWQQLEVDAGTYKKDVMRKSDPGQLNVGLADHFASRSEWSSFGRRGSAMGSVKAPHVSRCTPGHTLLLPGPLSASIASGTMDPLCVQHGGRWREMEETFA
jgi:hypothetical protein